MERLIHVYPVLAVSVGSHTNTSLLYRRALLPLVGHPSVPFLTFELYRGHMTWLYM